MLLRYVTSEYTMPLGVFVVRQAVRKTISSEKHDFENKKDMLNFGRNLVLNKLRYNIDNQLVESKILNDFNTQMKLSQF